MERTQRRDVLWIVATGAAGIGGCLSDDPADTGTAADPSAAPATTEASGTERTTDEPPTVADGGPVNYEVLQLGPLPAVPDWYDEDRPGYTDLFATEATARAVLGLDRLDGDRRAAVEQFVAGTNFERSRLLYLASVGPDTCHSEVTVRELRLGDGHLSGTFAANNPCGGDCSCGGSVTFPAALVRVTFTGHPTNTARLTAVDGWDDESTVAAMADRAVDPADLPGHVRPDGDPEPVGPLSCDDADVRRHGTGFDGPVAWGEKTDDAGDPTLALRADRLGYARGDEVAVRMTNVADGERYTGNRHKYGFQVYTTAGWQDVRGWKDDPKPYTDETVEHAPGEGFAWSLRLTEEGLVDGHPNEDALTVCPGLPSGRYRFAFWEPAVAVAFELED